MNEDIRTIIVPIKIDKNSLNFSNITFLFKDSKKN